MQAAEGKQSSTNRWIAFGIVTSVLTALIPIGITLYAQVQGASPESNDSPSKSEKATKKKHEDDDEPSAGAALGNKKKMEKDVVLDRSQFDTLTGCSCALPSNGPGGGNAGKKGVPTLQLALRLDSDGEAKIVGGPDSGDWLSFDVSWVLDVPGAEPMLLKGDRKDAPSTRVLLHKRAMNIAVGCDGTNMIVATQKAVSSWSSTDRKRRWSSPLADSVVLTATPAAAGLETDCSKIAVANGIATIPLVLGKVAKLRVADGSEAK